MLTADAPAELKRGARSRACRVETDLSQYTGGMADNQPDMQKVWDKIDKIANTVYIHEDRVASLELRHEQIGEELERLAKATTKAVETVDKAVAAVDKAVAAVAELSKTVQNYIRGVQDGGGTS